MNADERDALGRQVREIWIAWAKEQPAPKASWMVPWEDLGEPVREVDRRIGERLHAAGVAAERKSAVTRLCYWASKYLPGSSTRMELLRVVDAIDRAEQQPIPADAPPPPSVILEALRKSVKDAVWRRQRRDAGTHTRGPDGPLVWCSYSALLYLRRALGGEP